MKHAMTENAEILACSKSVGQMHYVRLDSIKHSVAALRASVETHMTNAGSMNALSTLIVGTPWNVKMRSVLTLVNVLDLQTAPQEITEAIAHAYLTILETHMGSLAHQVS